jgi:hypothetical protein
MTLERLSSRLAARRKPIIGRRYELDEIVQRHSPTRLSVLGQLVLSFNLLRWGFVAPAVILAAFLNLAWLSHTPPVGPWPFVISLAVAWLGFAWFAAAVPQRSVLITGVLCAIALRVVGLWSAPIYEDDWARYLWDGFRFLEDGTPYGYAPEAYSDFDLEEPWRGVLSQVNNPAVPTIYAPALQYVFAVSACIAPASLTALKGILIIFDLVLWAIVARLGGPAAGLRYALCPLVIFEVSFNAHADIIGATLTVACYALVRNARFVSAGLVAGLALACKPFAIVIAPSFLTRHGFVSAAAAGAVLVLLYAPFVLSGETEWEGLQIFSHWWEFNSLGFAGLKAVFGDPAARPVGFLLGASVAATLALHWRLKEPRAIPPADLWLLALLFFSPVINSWYLLWVVPWACLRPNVVTWSALPAVSLSYLTTGVLGIEAPGFHDHPVWVRPLEIAAAAAIYLSLRYGRRELPRIV